MVSSATDRITKVLDEKKTAFSRALKPQKISFRKLCLEWPWARRSEAYTHQIHKYPAKILPYIPIFFLSNISFASQDDIVMDPFAGTGTVLLESLIHPYLKRNSVGVELNPLARLIAKVKTTPLDIDNLRETSEKLVREIKTHSDRAAVPEFGNIDFWFSRRAQIELAKIRNCIETSIDSPDVKDFFWVCLSSIIREVSLADPRIPPPVLLRAEKFSNDPKQMRRIEEIIKRKRNPDPLSSFRNAISKNLNRVAKLNMIPEVKLGEVKATIIWDDARSLRWGRLAERGNLNKIDSKQIKPKSIGFVITSPPYISAQKYVRTTKFELLWLGVANEGDLRNIDREIIGTERVYEHEYRDIVHTGFLQVDQFIETVYKKNRKRAFITAKYFIDMHTVMKQIHRILKDNGRFVLVVGNNKICGEMIKNHVFISQIAQEIGFDLEVILVDEIKSRGMITKRHETGGLMLNEWVLVLKKGN